VEEEHTLEHIMRALYYFELHLLYASLVWFAAWVLTSIPRVSAMTKYWILVATALNFIFPLGAVVDRFWTSHFSWATPLSIIGDAASRSIRSPTAGVLCGVWLLGATLMFTRLCLRIRTESREAQAMAGQNPRAEAEFQCSWRPSTVCCKSASSGSGRYSASLHLTSPRN